jgi:hypothetical protein
MLASANPDPDGGPVREGAQVVDAWTEQHPAVLAQPTYPPTGATPNGGANAS